jgi:hypothetical protein
MYHIALFTFHTDLLARKLQDFVAGDWRGVELIDTTAGGAPKSTRGLDGVNQLPSHFAEAFPGYWVVFQRCGGVEHPLPDHARYRCQAHNDPEELNAFLSELARRNHWAVIPWGGLLADESFAFVTSEGWRLERFVAKGRNVTMLPWYSAGKESFRIVETDLLLARHAVARSLVDKATVALTEETDGGYFWNACLHDDGGLEGRAVWFAGPPPSRAGPDGRTLEAWADAGEVEAVGPVLDGEELSADDSWLYRVRRRDVFTRLVPWGRRRGNDGCQVLPAALPCDRAVELLRKYLTDRNPQYVARVARVISRAPWFYAAGECHEDADYSRFGTRRTDLLARYVAATHAGGFELVALF